MQRFIYKSKIHRATITDANLKYVGSITIDEKLLKAADIVPGEKVQIANLHNGARIETYVMAGKPNSGIICMNGAAARWAHPGDEVIIISYCLLTDAELKKHRPKIILVDGKNRITKKKV